MVLHLNDKGMLAGCAEHQQVPVWTEPNHDRIIILTVEASDLIHCPNTSFIDLVSKSVRLGRGAQFAFNSGSQTDSKYFWPKSYLITFEKTLLQAEQYSLTLQIFHLSFEP
jgi:hypothetical protein